MLVQLHHQNKKTSHCEMAAQADIDGVSGFREFLEDVRGTNPLPDDCIWMLCNEKSPHFLWAAALGSTDA